MQIETDADVIRSLAENLDASGVQYRLQAALARPLMAAWNKELTADIPTDEFLKGCAGFVASLIANLARSYRPDDRETVVEYLKDRLSECLEAVELEGLPGPGADIDGIRLRTDD